MKPLLFYPPLFKPLLNPPLPLLNPPLFKPLLKLLFEPLLNPLLNPYYNPLPSFYLYPALPCLNLLEVLGYYSKIDGIYYYSCGLKLSVNGPS